MFPALGPSVPLLRRGPAEVQLGLDPDGTVVLSGLSEAEIRSLELLDGSLPLEDVLAPQAGSDRFGRLVLDLLDRGLLVDARSSARRPHPSILVDGDGATSRELADLLRQSGAQVLQGRSAFDDLDLAHRSGHTPSAGDQVDLLVRVAAGALSPVGGRPVDDLVCLPVLLRPRSVVVGPFVDSTGPCLLCLDLTRADHDPAWAHLLAQMGRLHEPASASALTTMAAALACSRILAHLDATTPESRDLLEPDVSVEMSMHPPRVVRRTWSRHPRCHRHPR
ncbi:hypothetical protein [Mobilicoccus caccae]|uniref:Cyclodehydratase n=1 Tax=Mobilicoccus caccae TaxID=1859295 RepID=A0ABQ6IN93_9MICO|nr:hypothetical protein [Mobilicoccus caccae]GMA38901.1 cyclodehydratase [Mobilicoccus caccae]